VCCMLAVLHVAVLCCKVAVFQVNGACYQVSSVAKSTTVNMYSSKGQN
jgi:hypothetical protein